MMTRALVAAATALSVFATPLAAHADDWKRGHGHGGYAYGNGYSYKHGGYRAYDHNRYYGHNRYYDRRDWRGHGSYRHHKDDDDGDAVVAGVAGLAIGALIGSAIASDRARTAPPPPPVRYPPPRYDGYGWRDDGYDRRGRICVTREDVWDAYQRRYISVETSRYC